MGLRSQRSGPLLWKNGRLKRPSGVYLVLAALFLSFSSIGSAASHPAASTAPREAEPLPLSQSAPAAAPAPLNLDDEEPVDAPMLPPDSDCSDGQCVFPVTRGADDASEDPCTYQVDGPGLYFGSCEDTEAVVTAGYIFRNIPLPRGTQIAQAYIEFAVDWANLNYSLPVSFYGEPTANPDAFSAASRPADRPRTSPAPSVPWGIPEFFPWELGTVRVSPDLTSIVQEIINRPDWQTDSNGIDILSTLTEPPLCIHESVNVVSYDRSPLDAPRLVIRLKNTDSYPNFTAQNTAMLSILDSARIVSPDNVLRLTDPTRTGPQTGYAWHRIPPHVADRFDTAFSFRARSANGRRGGFAFVMQYASPGVLAQGQGGVQLGYGGIANSLAVEFDPGADPASGIDDLNAFHISVQTEGEAPNSASHEFSLGLVTPTTVITDGQWHTARIQYESDPDRWTGILRIYLDEIGPGATPILTAPLNLSNLLRIDAQKAWVGFTAATDSGEQYDILNWNLAPQWRLSCLDYDFTTGDFDHGYKIENGLGHAPHTQQYQEGVLFKSRGWRTTVRSDPATRGLLNFQRGMTEDTQPLFTNDGFSPRLVNAIQDPDNPKPIQTVRIEYNWLNSPYNSAPPPPTATLTMTMEFRLDGQLDLQTQTVVLTPAEPINLEGNFISDFEVEDLIDPAGVRLHLALGDPKEAVYVKKVSFCFVGDAPQRPPVVPPGSQEACRNLLTSIKSRTQPFGPGSAQQPEFNFPNDVTLEPYPEFSLNAAEYPELLLYSDLPQEYAVVPCAFKQNGEFYNPAPDSTLPFQPIVRFTAIGPDPDLREQLSLLNYAAYYSVGAKHWCYPNDDVFSMMYDRSRPETYRTGYNVPTPRYRCDQVEGARNGVPIVGKNTGSVYGPCGTFVGSLYRAMGYFNVNAFAKTYQINPVNAVSSLSGLYYGATPYQYGLDRNTYWPVNQILIRPDNTIPTYTPHPVTFTAISVLPLDNCQEIDPDTGSCIRGDQIYGEGIYDSSTYGNWTKPITKVLSPLSKQQPLGNDPEQIWRAIKPGDLAITWIKPEGKTPTYTHIQVVVGWGPSPRSNRFTPGGKGTREGLDFYPTYDAIPGDLRPEFVPYVMDRYMLPGTGSTTGPRPFHYGLSSTGTDFWLAVDASNITTSIPAESPKAISRSSTSLPIPQPHPFVPGNVVSWNPQGNLIALGNEYGITLYTPDLHKIWRLDEKAKTPVAGLAWSPDGQWLASIEPYRKVVIWDPINSTQVITLSGYREEFSAIAWNRDGSRLAASSYDTAIRIWGNSNIQPMGFGLKQTLYYTGTGSINALAWNPLDDRLAATDQTAVYIWDTLTGQLLRTFSLAPWNTGSLEWTPDGTQLLTPGPRIWNASPLGRAIPEYAGCSSGADTFAALSSDGRSIAEIGMAATGYLACVDPRTVANTQGTQRVFLPTYDSIAPVTTLDWDPDGKWIAFADRNGWLYITEPQSGTLQAVAPRWTDPTPPTVDLIALVNRCVFNDGVSGQLTQLLTDADYDTFTQQVQAQPIEIISPNCAAHLIKTMESLLNQKGYAFN